MHTPQSSDRDKKKPRTRNIRKNWTLLSMKNFPRFIKAYSERILRVCNSHKSKENATCYAQGLSTCFPRYFRALLKARFSPFARESVAQFRAFFAVLRPLCFVFRIYYFRIYTFSNKGGRETWKVNTESVRRPPIILALVHLVARHFFVFKKLSFEVCSRFVGTILFL